MYDDETGLINEAIALLNELNYLQAEDAHASKKFHFHATTKIGDIPKLLWQQVLVSPGQLNFKECIQQMLQNMDKMCDIYDFISGSSESFVLGRLVNPNYLITSVWLVCPWIIQQQWVWQQAGKQRTLRKAVMHGMGSERMLNIQICTHISLQSSSNV